MKRSGKVQAAGAAALVAAAIAAGSPANGAQATRFEFGRMPDGAAAPGVKLTNSHGVTATVIAYGASLQGLTLPDSFGRPVDIVLGYASLQEYLAKPQFFGATAGRYANRIARGRFTLGGHAYQLPLNDGANSLHGGAQGFDKRLWEVVGVDSGPAASVTLRLVSPDGDQGYPGRLTVEATYSLSDSNVLTIAYVAHTEAPTIVNLTNHTYWNLAGEGSEGGALGARLTLPAETFLPVDAGLIPTGERRPVKGTAFDFTAPHAIGERVREMNDEQIRLGRGYDHNFIVGSTPTPTLHLMARAADPASGRGFELWSNQPGLQVYSGNFLDATSHGKSGRAYRQGDAFVLEPQLFPDTPNQPAFGSARLEPGETYRNVIEYRFLSAG